LLQEEACDHPRRRDFRRNDTTPWWGNKSFSALPLLPGADKQQVAAADKQALAPKPLDRKLVDLKAHRCARGLCDHYGDKWSHDHKCAQ
jgi:hypothetical protein